MIAKYAVRPKPEPIEYPEGKDGRQVCNLKTASGKREYFRRTRMMALRQNQLCAICKRFLIEPTFDHERTRGGGQQDDRLLHPDGRWRNAALCWTCNGLKGSRRFHWLDGRYVAVEAKCS